MRKPINHKREEGRRKREEGRGERGEGRGESAAVFAIEDGTKNNWGRYFSFEQSKQDN